MAHAFIMEFEGATLAQYDAIMVDMELGGHLPAHALFHAAGMTDSGLMVCDVWDSVESFQAFAQEKIGPLSAKHGVPEPSTRDFAVQEIREGEPGAIGFMQVVTLEGADRAGFVALDEAVTGHTAPDGCVYHVSGTSGSDYMILDYWTTRAVHDAFMAEKVAPAMQAAGRPGPPAMDVVDVHNALTQAAVAH